MWMICEQVSMTSTAMPFVTKLLKIDHIYIY